MPKSLKQNNVSEEDEPGSMYSAFRC